LSKSFLAISPVLIIKQQFFVLIKQASCIFRWKIIRSLST
jgi:hypothetical protein